MNKEMWLEEAQALQEELVQIRRVLHQHAEVGFDLNFTKSFVKEKLIEYGYSPKDCGKCGLVATVGKKSGKVFLLRADMDALNMQEEANVDFACENGNMHACGHDMHTTMLLGAAKLLKKHEDELNGTIKLMFQPAEEIFQGSKDMIDDGLLENPKVDGAMMIHVVSNLEMEVGSIIVCAPGVSVPGADMFEIHIQGKGCHGSMPENGIDPLITAAHIVLGLEEIRTREIASSERCMLTMGMIQGGTAGNIIPDTAVIKGSLRAFDETVRNTLKKRIEEISKAMGMAYRCHVDVNYTSGCPGLLNNEKLCHQVYDCLKDLLGNKVMMPTVMTGSSGSEDFAYISQEVPSVMLSMAAGKPSDGHAYPQHHPKVTFDESALYKGVLVFVTVASNWFNV